MKKKICSLLFIALLSTFIYAEERSLPPANDTIVKSYDLDDITVIAFKTNNNLSTQPISASLFSEEMLSNHNIGTIKELTSLTPNFFMPDYGSKMTSPVYIRGIGSRINAPSVGLYVDGIPYFDRSSFDFNLNEIERIEVLRGPQGTLYGRNTMGGIINMYSKSPFKHKESNVYASAGNYDSYKLGGSVIGNIDNTFGYSFSGNYLHSGGYFDNTYTNKKADEMDMVNGRIRLGWSISPQLTAYLTSAYEYSDQDGYPYGVYNNEENKVNKVHYNAPSYYRRTMSNNGLTLLYTTPFFKLSSQTSFQYLKGRQGIDQDFTSADNYFVMFRHQQQMYSQETNIKSVGNGLYKWQFGVFGFLQNYAQTNDIEYRQLDRETITDVKNPTKGFALYHQSTLNKLFIENLSATAGIRYDWEKIKMENHTKTITTETIVQEPIFSTDIYAQITPTASLQYNFNHQLIYLSASKGYKTGGFNTTVEEEKDRVFKPEHSWCYELGTKANYFENLINFDFTLFYIDWRNQQISQKRATEQGFKLRNAGKSASKGFELTTQVNPLQYLNFQLNYGYTHATFKEYLYDESNSIDYSGNFLPLVPRNTFSLAANYVIPITRSWLDEIRLNAQYIGLGKLYWAEDNKATQDYYNTINAKISFVRTIFSIDLWAKNITNEKYITYYFESMGNKFAQQSKPFLLGVDIHIKF